MMSSGFGSAGIRISALLWLLLLGTVRGEVPKSERNQAGELRRFTGHMEMVQCVAFSRDGQYALSAGPNVKDGKRAGCIIRLWEVASGKEVRCLESHESFVESIAFSPDGKQVVSSCEETVRLWDVATGRVLQQWKPNRAPVWGVAFSPDGKSILTGGHSMSAPQGYLQLWDTATAKAVRNFAGHTSIVTQVVFSHDGKWVLSGSFDKTARIWDTATGREIHRLEGHERGVVGVAFGPDGKYVATSCTGEFKNQQPVPVENDVRLWDTATGKEVRRLKGHRGTVKGVIFSPDGKRIVSSGGSAGEQARKLVPFDCTIRLWDVATGKEVHCFTGHEGPVSSIAVSHDGKHALSGSVDTTVRLWKLPE